MGIKSFDGLFPVDIVDDVKTEGGLYKTPQNKCVIESDEIEIPFSLTGIAKSVLINFADPTIQIPQDELGEQEELFSESNEENWDIKNENGNLEIHIIVVDGAASCCTGDEMYSGLENL